MESHICCSEFVFEICIVNDAVNPEHWKLTWDIKEPFVIVESLFTVLTLQYVKLVMEARRDSLF